MGGWFARPWCVALGNGRDGASDGDGGEGEARRGRWLLTVLWLVLLLLVWWDVGNV